MVVTIQSIKSFWYSLWEKGKEKVKDFFTVRYTVLITITYTPNSHKLCCAWSCPSMWQLCKLWIQLSDLHKKLHFIAVTLIKVKGIKSGVNRYSSIWSWKFEKCCFGSCWEISNILSSKCQTNTYDYTDSYDFGWKSICHMTIRLNFWRHVQIVKYVISLVPGTQNQTNIPEQQKNGESI